MIGMIGTNSRRSKSLLPPAGSIGRAQQSRCGRTQTSHHMVQVRRLPLNPHLKAMTMNDFTDDTDTPTEADLDALYGSKYLSAADIGDKKIRTKITKVSKAVLQQQGGQARAKFILSFATTDKTMVLNVTNKNILVDALGRNPADWIGVEVGILAEPTTYAGKPTRGLRLRVLNRPVAMPTPKPAAKPAATASWEAPWDDDRDGDAVPDFGETVQ